MLNNNTVVRNSCSTNISMNPPCIGTLQRTHSKSQFVRCHVGSEYAKEIFDFEPHINKTIIKHSTYSTCKTKERIDLLYYKLCVLEIMNY